MPLDIHYNLHCLMSSDSTHTLNIKTRKRKREEKEREGKEKQRHLIITKLFLSLC